MHNLTNYIKKHYRIILASFLLINFSLRLLIYFNTTLFYFGDYQAYLNGIDLIKENGSIPLIQGNFLYLNSYIGYFFKHVLGNIDWYFIFNSLLGTAASFFVFLITVRLSKNPLTGLLTVVIHTLYMEFLVWSSVFYTPVIMMFLLSIIIYLLINFIDVRKARHYIITGLLIIALVNLTFYFKCELNYFWILLFLFAILHIRNKQKKIFIRVFLLALLLTVSTGTLNHYHILPNNKGNIIANDFIFFGHTLYGGDGGDGSFIYKENEERYNKALEKYCEQNKIDKLTKTDRNNFQMEEIKKFITQHPFKWIYLQGYKFCRFFGIVPESSSFRILVSGMLKGKIILTSLLLVIPFAVMVLLMVITFNTKKVITALRTKPMVLLLALILLYYLAASVFFGQYQEKYRMPLMVCLLIPYLSWAIIKFNYRELINNKVLLFIKTTVIILILIIWSLQAYNALVVHKDRYIGTAKSISK